MTCRYGTDDTIPFDTACLLARAAAIELDIAARLKYHDPLRYEDASAEASEHFGNLVDAAHRKCGWL